MKTKFRVSSLCILLAMMMVVSMCLVSCKNTEQTASEAGAEPTSEPSGVGVVTPREVYAGEWMEKTEEFYRGTDLDNEIIIDEIYADCFFAHCVIPRPYTIKVNGVLSDEWCVGDQVSVTYENAYYDKQNRAEADLVTIAPSELELDSDVCYKPVIYLYPEEPTEVDVALTLNGELTCTYPAYQDGWKVHAMPDGTLTDANGQTYNYLYWEGETYSEYDFSKGFCVKGEDTAAFLEDALSKLGLNRKEANEFIVYWLPLMQENAYNVISFQETAYTDAAKLEVSPNPDTLIRVFMTYKACDEFVHIEVQELTAPLREGFTVVEWGGTEVVD